MTILVFSDDESALWFFGQKTLLTILSFPDDESVF